MRCPDCDAQVSDRVPVCPRCGGDIEPAEPARDALIGQVIGGKYQIVEVLGEGGMGRVYRAIQSALGQEIAVKTIRPDFAKNREVARRFFREARASAQLRHPNSVNIFDFGESGGTLYLAMELLSGRPLEQLLVEEGPLSPPRVAAIAGQVLEVLEAAHNLSIVHRDLKPDNILVEDLPGRADFVKVVDFGIAKITDPLRAGGTQLTQTGMVLGTPAYMSPEQVLGEPVDSRADFYSLGVICYELLAGAPPFSGNIGALLRAHLHETPPPITEHRPDVPAALATLLSRVLDKDRDKRPATAAQFARALSGAVDTSSRSTLPGGAPGPEAIRCPSCATVAAADARFCRRCGASLGDDRGGDRFGDLRRHLPGGVVDAVASLGRPAERKRRELVVAALDLGAADREIRGDLDALLSEIAGRHQAVFERRAAHLATASFGVEGALADDVERAVRAALEMRAAVAHRCHERGSPARLSVAIHRGAASVSADGAIDPIGDLVELPARLLGASEPGRVVVSDAVRQRLGPWCRSRRLAPARLRGLSGAVARFEVVAVTAAGDRRLAAAPLCGRDALIAELVDRVREAAVFVDLEGEVGSGKSRLLAALRGPLLASRMRPVAVSAAGSGRSPVIASLLKALESDGGLTGCGLEADKLDLLRRWASGAPLALAARDLRIAIAGAVREALGGFAGQKRAALLIDAVERADPLGAELIATLAAEPVEGLSVIAARRSGHRAPWADRRGSAVVSLRLPPLATGDIEAMVAALVAPAEPPGWMTALVGARSGGSPLMALELVGALIDAGAIARDAGGSWRLSEAPVDIGRPASFGALIGQRIDGLDRDARRLAAILAVAGEPVELELLAEIAGGPIDAAVETLGSRQLAAVSGNRVGFASDAVAERVAELLDDAERRRWHEAVARALDAGDHGADPARIAEHFAAAGCPGEALDRYERAANDAAALGGPGGAAPVLLRAAEVAALHHAAEAGAASARRLCAVGLRAAAAHLEIGDLARLDDLVKSLAVPASDAGDPRIGARLDRLRARLALARGDTARALRGLDEVIAGALALRDSKLYAEAHADLGETHEKRGELDAAADCLVRSLELVQRGSTADVKRLSLRALGALARVLLRRGEHARARELLDQAIELARELDDPVAEARALGNIAGVHNARGDLAGAIEAARRSLQASRRCGDLIGAARQLNNLGALHLAARDSGAAREHYEAAYRAARQIAWREGMAAAAAGRERAGG